MTCRAVFDKITVFIRSLESNTYFSNSKAQGHIMNVRIKQYILIGILAAAAYFIMDNHFIIDGNEVHRLKKTSLHLHYTFFSLKEKKPEKIMQIDYLREAGIGELLVELGLMSEDQRFKLESEYYE